MACNDYGVVLQSPHRIDMDKPVLNRMFSPDDLIPDILDSVNSAEMARRQFRQVAKVAGLIQGSYPGLNKSASYIQASSNLFFDMFTQYDPGNLLL